MTKRLKSLMARIERWPKQAQVDAVNSLLAIEDEYLGGDDFSLEDRGALERSAEDVRSGLFADDDAIRETLDRYRRA